VGTIQSWSKCDFVDEILMMAPDSRYVVDCADSERIPESKDALFDLLKWPTLSGIPLLVLGNKNDLSDAISVKSLVDVMLVSFHMFLTA
jgi:hypothetical protein